MTLDDQNKLEGMLATLRNKYKDNLSYLISCGEVHYGFNSQNYAPHKHVWGRYKDNVKFKYCTVEGCGIEEKI